LDDGGTTQLFRFCPPQNVCPVQLAVNADFLKPPGYSSEMEKITLEYKVDSLSESKSEAKMVEI
jgi:hypothetical protein